MKQGLVLAFALAALPVVAAAADKPTFFSDSIQYMDKLKTCTPHTLTFKEMPLPGMNGKTVIDGKRGKDCSVTTTYVGSKTKVACLYSPETVKLLTSEAKYKQMRDHVVSARMDDPAAQAVAAECKIQ